MDTKKCRCSHASIEMEKYTTRSLDQLTNMLNTPNNTYFQKSKESISRLKESLNEMSGSCGLDFSNEVGMVKEAERILGHNMDGQNYIAVTQAIQQAGMSAHRKILDCAHNVERKKYA